MVVPSLSLARMAWSVDSSPGLPKVFVGQENELSNQESAAKRPAGNQENQFDVDMRFRHGRTSSGPAMFLASMASFQTLATASSVA